MSMSMDDPTRPEDAEFEAEAETTARRPSPLRRPTTAVPT